MNVQKRLIAKAILSVILMGVLSGCGMPDKSDTYVATLKAYKDYEFNQPSMKKAINKHAGVTSKINFTQELTELEQKGWANAKVTVNELFYKAVDKDGEKYIFDSTDEKYASNKLNNLIGKTYTIKMGPEEQIQVIDVGSVYSAVSAGTEAKIARGLFKKERIQERHKLTKMPEEITKKVRPGQTWTKVEDSPSGLLMSKKYQKRYTVEEVKGGRKAIVSIDALPQQKDTDYQISEIQEMIDTEDDFSGKMTFDIRTGKVENYYEKLNVTYTAIGQNDKEAPPDTLILGFSHEMRLEKIK
jgi:hypothetical protein